jgi:hypothetical protein
MNKKQLKRLAEKHFYLGKKLTPEESFILENSKYKNIVKKETKFSKMLEQYSYGEQEQPFKVKYTKRRRMAIPGIDKSVVRDLVDDIEDRFNLGIENSSPGKYNNVDVNEVKQFIQQYADKNLFDGNMLREVQDVMNSETVYDVLHKLYTLEM